MTSCAHRQSTVTPTASQRPHQCTPLHGAIALGDGYTLLHKHAKYPILPDANVVQLISAFLQPGQEMPCIRKWARLLLPNGQIACSTCKETLKAPEQLQVSHNIKFLLNGNVQCSEVQYFAQIPIQTPDDTQKPWEFCTVVILRLYSKPDNKLLELSLQVISTSELLNDIIVTDVRDVRSVVAMIPNKLTLPDSDIEAECFCMVERPGLDISDLGIPYSVYMEDNDNDANEVE
ncbi:hypothetical protein PAXRUDRAFT_171734 [Paxillus rubicundulus Ve08.2h10]|uniref:Uncharacterized protein n=1 Tax=Paxillus rubicundulus Ve08.2h10 TaxID=930991 RepID=A0A0D0CXA6_9AGAM|nr:hypothetical protein PAXRUDRAFT_171734 [Paxillus rubicundulus Ve08.2h10]